MAVSLDQLTLAGASRLNGGGISLAAAGAALEHEAPWAENSGAKAELSSTGLPVPVAVRVSTTTNRSVRVQHLHCSLLRSVQR